MANKVVEVVLPNNAVALVRVSELDQDAVVAGAEKVSWPETFDFEQVSSTLEGVAEALRSSLARANPKKTKVELGFELTVRNGKLVGLLVEGQASASLRVTLEWGDDKSGHDSGQT